MNEKTKAVEIKNDFNLEFDKTLRQLKETFPRVSRVKKDEDLELHLYKKIHGCHFTDWLVEKATSKMLNEDESTGRHWSVEQTTSAARQSGVTFDKFNEYDWNYVMNMIYSNYYGAVFLMRPRHI